MFEFKEYVKPSSVWPTAKDFEDKGARPGLVRGYNIEIRTSSGATDWLSANYIAGEPEEHFNDEFHLWYYSSHNWVPTGRIMFRGYGKEEWSVEEREMLVRPCDENGRE